MYPNDDDCFVSILNKQTGENRAYNVRSLKDKSKLKNILNHFGKEDIYMSLNTFRTMRGRARSDLLTVSKIPVDIDYKKIPELKDLKDWQIINMLKEDYFDQKIPTPSHIEKGNQIRLIYDVVVCYLPKYKRNLATLCTRICEVFAERLKEFGAEKQNIESYARVPTSINTKSGDIVHLVKCDDSIVYTVGELQELWLDEIPSWYKKRKGKVKASKNNKVIKLHNMYSFNLNRLRDLEKIQAHINKSGRMNYRARLCFLYRNFVLVQIKYQKGELKEEDFIYAEEQMLKFNSKFKEPCRPHVIARNTRNLNKNQYLFRNETLLSWLELTWELCEELGLESIYKPKTQEQWNKDYYKKNSKKLIENEKAKYQKNLKERGKITKSEEVSQRRAKIKDLLAEGLSQKEIYEHLNISKRTCINDVNYLREQGLI